MIITTTYIYKDAHLPLKNTTFVQIHVEELKK